MGWADMLAGIGAASGGALNAWQQHEELQSRERIAKAQDDVRRAITEMNTRSRETIQDKKDAAAFDREQLKAKTQEKITNLISNRVMDVEALKSNTQKELRRMLDENNIDVEEYRAMVSMRGQDINQAIQKAHDESNERRTSTTANAAITVGAGNNAATVGAAQTRAQASRDVAGITQGGLNERAAADRPLKAFRAEQGRYPRGSGAAAAARYGGQPVNEPMFGPSYGDFLKGYSQQQPPPPSPSFAAPPFEMTKPSGPSPFAPSSMMPSMPQPPPGIAAQPPTSIQPEPNMSMAPPKVLPGMSPSAPAAPPPVTSQAPPPTTAKTPETEERLAQQATDLMKQIKEAESAGDFKRGRALRQILLDLMKQ